MANGLEGRKESALGADSRVSACYWRVDGLSQKSIRPDGTRGRGRDSRRRRPELVDSAKVTSAWLLRPSSSSSQNETACFLDVCSK